MKKSNGHFVTVTTQDVIEAICIMSVASFTTEDVASSLNVPERPVRTAVKWLMENGLVKECEGISVRRLTKNSRKPYFPKAYELIVKQGPADFELLNRVFLFRQ